MNVKFILPAIFAFLIFLQSCSQYNKPSEAGNTADKEQYYSVDDFLKIKKFDSHHHLNTYQEDYIYQAQEDNIRLLIIVDDRPFGISMEDQQKIIRQQLKKFPGQLSYATTFSVKGFNSDSWQEQTIDYLKNSFAHGAIAVKVWKNIGMDLKDENGTFVMIDDPKFDPVIAFLVDNDIPLIGHLGEPRDCWFPIEKMTFHQSYYKAHPEYHMYLHPEYPSYEDQINARDNLLEKNPDLKFIGAHLGSLEWSLEELAKRLDKYPNMAVDLARMSNLKHHAMTDWQKTREFFIKYQDRLLYATDVQIRESEDVEQMKKRAHDSRISDWKFFTSGEVFNTSGIGEYKGLHLPREVIDKIYRKNAEKWLPGIQQAL